MGKEAGKPPNLLCRHLGQFAHQHQPLGPAIIHEHHPFRGETRVDQQDRPPAGNQSFAGLLGRGPPCWITHAQGIEQQQPRAPSSHPQSGRLGELGRGLEPGRGRACSEVLLTQGSTSIALGKWSFCGHRSWAWGGADGGVGQK